MDTAEVFVGIDAAAAHPALAVRPGGAAWRAATDPDGQAETAARIAVLGSVNAHSRAGLAWSGHPLAVPGSRQRVSRWAPGQGKPCPYRGSACTDQT